MDILSLLSNLQNSNIDLSKVISSFANLFGAKKDNQDYSPANISPITYYELPNYDFGNQNSTQGNNNTIKQTQRSNSINTQNNKSNSQNSFDLNKMVELAQVILPLFNSMKKEKKAVSTDSNVNTASNKKSEILSLTRI